MANDPFRFRPFILGLVHPEQVDVPVQIALQVRRVHAGEPPEVLALRPSRTMCRGLFRQPETDERWYTSSRIVVYRLANSMLLGMSYPSPYRALFRVGDAGDLAPFLHLLFRVGRGAGVRKPGLAGLLGRRFGEQSGLGGLQRVDVALVLIEQDTRRLHIAGTCEL